jgi:dynein heavy chain
MKKKAQEMQRKKALAEEELAQTEANLKELNESLAELNKNREIKQGELDVLEARSAEMTRKLNAASKLITGLGAEQKRWTIDMEQYKVDKVMLVGDCLTASSFLSYCGPFNFVMRKKMLFEHWKKDLIEKELPNSDNFLLSSFLSNDVEISRWASESLPGDELSIQNGILTTFASRWPLCIDPQMQAVTWIKNKEPKLLILTFNMGNYVKLLENAIKFGTPVLFEGIDTEIDPIIDPVLEKNITTKAGVKVITLADNEIEWTDEFQMFMTTKIANPSYTPEVFGKTMIINFNVTLLGLRDQLLNEVVGYERPELEATRVKLVKETSANRTELKELEDTLLSELSKETDVPLVDNDPLIEVLEIAKTKSVKIGEDLENARVTTIDIE